MVSDSRNNNNSVKPIENNSPAPKKIVITTSNPEVKQPEHALSNATHDVIRLIGSKLKKHSDLASLSRCCLRFYHATQADRHLRKHQELLQAVLDDKGEIVERILNIDPRLVMVAPKNLVLESQYTWLLIHAESAWQIAGKLGLAKMVKRLRSFVDKLDAADKAAVLAQWSAPDVKNPEEKARLDAKNEKLREEYREFLQPLAAVIAQEPCANGYNGELSAATETALAAFRKITLPDAAVKLDDYYDVKQLFLAAGETYRANFNVFPAWNQRDVFGIRVIGWIQSLVPPELGKIFCEGLWNVVAKGQVISERAAALIMADGKRFYRASRNSLDGLGGKFLCDVVSLGGGEAVAGVRGESPGFLQNYVEQTNPSLANSCRNCVPESSIVPRR